MKNFLFSLTLLLATSQMNAQVGIGTNSPDPSAQLEIQSTTGGLLIPRMTAAERIAISPAATGLLVFQTDAAPGFYYFNGTAWVNLTTGGAGGVATGTIMAYAGSTAPEGWAFCNGSAISRTTQVNLFTAIGTTYGSGDGSTTFNLPDLRGRTIFGLDNMGGVAAANRLTTAGGISQNNTLGATGGSQTLTLSSSHLPSHNHSISLTTNSTGSHTHTYSDAYFAENSGTIGGSVGSNGRFGTGASTDGDNSFMFRTSGNGHSASQVTINTSSNSDHSHTVSGNTGNTGSGTAFESVNPAIVLNYIIKL